MKILAMDDEYLGLEGLISGVKEAAPDAELKAFQNVQEALDCAKDWIPEVALLDIEMRLENGIIVAKKLKEINPRINIIFVTGYSEYMKEAFELYASGYVLKPVMAEHIKRELENLRFPLQENKRIRVQAFGEFEIFADGLPVHFMYARSRELLAIIIDSGGNCSMGKIEELLWENEMKDNRAYIRNLIADIRRQLRKYDAEDLVLRAHNQVGLDLKKIDCDYLDFLEGKPDAVSKFTGEYMSQYSWAEKTLGSLLQMRKV